MILEEFGTLKDSFAFDRDYMDAEHSELRKHAVVATIFALMALLLEAIGLSAVIAHSVSQRTREIGVRIAIGAAADDLRRMVLREGMVPVAIGLMLGLAASLAVNRVLQSQLVGVSSYDLVTRAGAPVVLIVVALLALRVFGAATVGAAAAAGYAIASGLAFNALSRGLEMGAIPLLLAAFVFVGLLGGTVAGLLCRERPYLAAFLASFLVFVFATGVNDLKEQLTPAMTRDERREFWASIEGLLFGGFPFGVPFALWGALLTNVNPGRLGAPRVVSYPLAGLIGFGALTPVAVHWLSWPIGLAVAAVSTVAFIVWIMRRNRQPAQP